MLENPITATRIKGVIGEVQLVGIAAMALNRQSVCTDSRPVKHCLTGVHAHDASGRTDERRQLAQVVAGAAADIYDRVIRPNVHHRERLGFVASSNFERRNHVEIRHSSTWIGCRIDIVKALS